MLNKILQTQGCFSPCAFPLSEKREPRDVSVYIVANFERILGPRSVSVQASRLYIKTEVLVTIRREIHHDRRAGTFQQIDYITTDVLESCKDLGSITTDVPEPRQNMASIATCALESNKHRFHHDRRAGT